MAQVEEFNHTILLDFDFIFRYTLQFTETQNYKFADSISSAGLCGLFLFKIVSMDVFLVYVSALVSAYTIE